MTSIVRTARRIATVLAVLALPGATVHAAAAGEVFAPSTATYRVEFRGINAGTLAFTMRPLAAGRYVYESVATPRGLAKLFVRGAVREASTFALDGGAIRPLEYVLDDGSPRTADDTQLAFDWDRGIASGQHEDAPVQIALAPGVQDRMSVQVLVMQQLASGVDPGRIAFIDRNELKEYEYRREGPATIETPLGRFETVVYSSTRAGSSRVSRIWYAPALAYTPVRGEQLRRGSVETVLTLVSIDR